MGLQFPRLHASTVSPFTLGRSQLTLLRPLSAGKICTGSEYVYNSPFTFPSVAAGLLASKTHWPERLAGGGHRPPGSVRGATGSAR